MSLELYDIIRLAGNPILRGAPVDAITNNTPFAWIDNDWQFQIGYFNDPNNSAWIADASTVDKVYLELRPYTAGDPPPDPDVVAPVISANASPDDLSGASMPANWNDKTKQLFTVSIPRTATGRAQLEQGSYWLDIYILTTDDPAHKITLAAGLFIVAGTGTGAAASSAEATERLFWLPNVTQIASNGTTGLGDVPTADFNNGKPYAVLCPDASTGGSEKVLQFWYVKTTSDDDAAGFIQSGPDSDDTGLKWVHA